MSERIQRSLDIKSHEAKLFRCIKENKIIFKKWADIKNSLHSSINELEVMNKVNLGLHETLTKLLVQYDEKEELLRSKEQEIISEIEWRISEINLTLNKYADYLENIKNDLNIGYNRISKINNFKTPYVRKQEKIIKAMQEIKILSVEIEKMIKNPECYIEEKEDEPIKTESVSKNKNNQNENTLSVFIPKKEKTNPVDTIYSGESLETCESISSTKECFATLKPDGNFVLYHTLKNGVTELWSTKTSSIDAQKLTLGKDGNLVLTDVNGNTVWETKTSNIGEPPYRLTMQSDGNLVIYDKNYEPTWATNTYSKTK